MNAKKKIKVLVVDDSLVFRETIAREIQKDFSIEVVGTASDPYIARDQIIEHQPDVMVLDIEMPKMNGIEFLKKLMPQYPIPVIVISSIENNSIEAMKVGAVDFVSKVSVHRTNGMKSLINELIVKIKLASIAKVGHWKKNMDNEKSSFSSVEEKIIAIGSSTGGTEAVAQILKNLPKKIPAILIVQHMPPNFTKMYAERLNNSCKIEVKEAEDGDKILPGRALIAPGGYQMELKRKANSYFVHCYKGEKVNGHRPSVDVLFKTVAELCGKNALGVILTGMGSDGAKGLLSMRMQGAKTLGQDPKSCVVYGMPKVAFEIGAVEKQISIENMAQAIMNCLDGRI